MVPSTPSTSPHSSTALTPTLSTQGKGQGSCKMRNSQENCGPYFHLKSYMLNSHWHPFNHKLGITEEDFAVLLSGD